MSFAALPAELRLRIIKESIEAQPPAVSSSATAPAAIPNVQQAILLAQVSRNSYAIVAELLYHTIRISRPSSLLELRATLKTSPRLAVLIVNLHIGADNELAQRGWPIVEERGSPSRIGCPIQTTLSEAKCPSWCKAGATSNIKLPEIRARTIAVDDALRDAMRDIDVEPQRSGRSHSGKHIGVGKWAERLFLLQAALDIYLVETKRLEEAADSAAPPQNQEDSESSLDVEYPRLQVLVHPSPREASADETGDGNLVTVTSEQLWDHLLKRGGPADHFDHLVRLTRSTRQSLGMISKEEWGRVRRMLSGSDLREGSEAGEEEGGKKEETGWEDKSSKERHPLDGHRVEALLAAARDIFGLTANIRSLSLTSFLHRALSAPTLPQSLRGLVIGPRTSYWDDVLPSVASLSAFNSLKRLRLVGKITEHDAFKIAYEIPSLREVEWEMPERSMEKSSTIYDTIKLLQGPQRFGDEDASGESLEAGKTSSTDSSSISQSKSSCPSRHTTIHLYRHIIIRMLALASLEPGELGNLEAWEKGSSVPGALHRIKIADSDVLTSPAKLAIWEEKDFGTLLRRSLEWWEERGRAGG